MITGLERIMSDLSSVNGLIETFGLLASSVQVAVSLLFGLFN